MRTIVRIVGNAVGPVGVGLALTGWVNPWIGVVCLGLGAAYILWELFALPAVTKVIPGMLRFVAAVMVCSIAVGLSWSPIKSAVHKKQGDPSLSSIAADVGEIKSKINKPPQKDISKEIGETAAAKDSATIRKIPGIPANPKTVLDRPLEILSFESFGRMTISNHNDQQAYVIGMQTSAEIVTSYIDFGFAVRPRATQTFELPHNQPNLTSIRKLGETWRDHYQKALELYEAECLVLVYFSANDGGLEVMNNHYRKQGEKLGSADATGMLHYRIGEEGDTKTQLIPLVVAIMRKSRCNPK